MRRPDKFPRVLAELGVVEAGFGIALVDACEFVVIDGNLRIPFLAERQIGSGPSRIAPIAQERARRTEMVRTVVVCGGVGVPAHVAEVPVADGHSGHPSSVPG